MKKEELRMKKFKVSFYNLFVIFFFALPAWAGYPENARYTDEASKIFWFMQISDTHVGEGIDGGTQDTENLNWITGPAFEVIAPEFIVLTGDITDSTNGGIIPNGPFQAEWDTYRNLLIGNGITADILYDLPGNHDQYNDGELAFYLNNSIQGAATGQSQHSWALEYDFGVYHFLGVATCGDDGRPFPVDNTGLNAAELGFAESELTAHADANLTFTFGHHPIENFLHGAAEFENLLANYGVSLYSFGHIHGYDVYWMDDTLRFNLASLGKSPDHQYALYAVDNDGLAVNWGNVNEWPLIVITAPLDLGLGGGNPFTYVVSADYEANPVRVLVFDEITPSFVRFRVNDGDWIPMTDANDPLWEGTFDARPLAAGLTTLEVQANGSSSKTQIIHFNLDVTACYDGQDNDSDGFIDYPDDPGCYSPSDQNEADHPPADDDTTDDDTVDDDTVDDDQALNDDVATDDDSADDDSTGDDSGDDDKEGSGSCCG